MSIRIVTGSNCDLYRAMVGEYGIPVVPFQVAEKSVDLTIEGVRQQSPVLDKVLEKGEIQIAGGMYDIETDKVPFS